MRDTVVFLSDFHLGLDARDTSRQRELKIVRFFRAYFDRLSSVYLVGDVFDFWFEYRHVVPRGFVRFMGVLAELADAGVEIHFFHGNHDMWLADYVKGEFGARVHRDKLQIELQGRQFFIAHGDGLGPDDQGYKRLKKVFRNPTARWWFQRLHPDVGIGIARSWSQRSRLAEGSPRSWQEDKEWLIQYARRKKEQFPDTEFFVFGHRHLPIDYALDEHTRYINLGEWLYSCSYAELHDGELSFKAFENDGFQPFPKRM